MTGHPRRRTGIRPKDEWLSVARTAALCEKNELRPRRGPQRSGRLRATLVRCRRQALVAAPRLLVVSHPCVVEANQAVYAELLQLGWDIHLVVPASWRHEYASETFVPRCDPHLSGRFHRRRVWGAGKPASHVYRRGPGCVVKAFRPAAAFIEEETFAAPAFQWAQCLYRARIPYVLQADENLDRPLHPIARLMQRWALPRAALVAARSQTARDLVARLAPGVPTSILPHAVPAWPAVPAEHGRASRWGSPGASYPRRECLISLRRRNSSGRRSAQVGRRRAPEGSA